MCEKKESRGQGCEKNKRFKFLYAIYYYVYEVVLLYKTVSVRLETQELEDVNKASESWKADRSETVRRLLARALKEWKTEKALKDLQEHKISIGLAAKRASLNLWEMLDLIRQKNINWTGYSKEDLEKDFKAMEGKK